MPFRRGRFAEVIDRQLDLFAADREELLEECDAALARYNTADRDDAEELYGDYLDLVETGTELLVAMRDTFARTLGADDAERYEAEFNRAVERRLPAFALELEDR
jgi:hypothetical protein